MKSKLMTVLVTVTAAACLLSACTTPGGTSESTTASEATSATEETQASETETSEADDPLKIVIKDFGASDKWRINGDCKVTTDDKGKAVITDRATANSGIEIPIDAYRGNKVRCEAALKSANPGVTLSLRYNIFGNVSYVNITSMKPEESLILGFKGDIEIPENATDIVIYLEANDVKDMTVSSMSVSVLGEYNDLTNTPVAELKDPSSYDSLKEVYKDYFKMGAAVPATVMTNTNEEFRKLVIQEFNSVTCENDLKPENVLDTEANLADPAKYNECPAIHFDAAKPTLDFCKENGIQMRGHTLVWHSQTPSWFFYKNYDVNGELADRELMLKRMENYIDQVTNWCEENYPGVIYAWDVVNEAAGDNGGMRDSYWTQIIGEDFVEKAFEFARKHAPKNVELFYNDYNEYQPAKQTVIIDMLKPIAKAGNIDGMGMQSHIGAGLMPETYVNSMNTYAKELGVKIHITEMDVSAPNSANAMYDQGTYMKKLFEALIAAKKDGTPIECVTFWGLTDEMSWKSADKPLLFYGDISPKPAFEGVVCAVTGGEVTKPADYVEVQKDFTPIKEDYEDQKYIGKPRASSTQKIVGDAFEGDYCLENSGGTAEWDGYSIDISRFIGQKIKFSFAVKTECEMVCLTGDIDGTWPHLIEVDTSSGDWVEASGEWTVPDGMTTLSLYFETTDMSSFCLDNVLIEVVEE
ncbi:MAG: endo-1,4-beta-xylanase [Clostridiales bacterium]|nr:endo-1,4-beta-xylanase [Clostridiales bacterium]